MPSAKNAKAVRLIVPDAHLKVHKRACNAHQDFMCSQTSANNASRAQMDASTANLSHIVKFAPLDSFWPNCHKVLNNVNSAMKSATPASHSLGGA
jgi:hypothetical protein